MLDRGGLTAEAGHEERNLVDIGPVGGPDAQTGTGISPTLLQVTDDLVLRFEKRITETIEDLVGHGRWHVLAAGENLPSIRIDDHRRHPDLIGPGAVLDLVGHVPIPLPILNASMNPQWTGCEIEFRLRRVGRGLRDGPGGQCQQKT